MRRVSQSVLLLMLLSAGCKNCDLVEAELRYVNNRLACLENETLLKDAEINTLRATIDTLQVDPSQPGANAKPPEEVFLERGISRIVLGMMTGGRDTDRDGRDDGIQVALETHDYDDDIIKAPGKAEVTLYEVREGGVKRQVSVWEVGPEQLRDSWRSTMISQGYQLVLPWQEMPTKNKVRAVVRFTTLDGREFEAERDFQISLTPKPGAASAKRMARPMRSSPIDCPPASNEITTPPAEFEEPGESGESVVIPETAFKPIAPSPVRGAGPSVGKEFAEGFSAPGRPKGLDRAPPTKILRKSVVPVSGPTRPKAPAARPVASRDVAKPDFKLEQASFNLPPPVPPSKRVVQQGAHKERSDDQGDEKQKSAGSKAAEDSKPSVKLLAPIAVSPR